MVVRATNLDGISLCAERGEETERINAERGADGLTRDVHCTQWNRTYECVHFNNTVLLWIAQCGPAQLAIFALANTTPAKQPASQEDVKTYIISLSSPSLQETSPFQLQPPDIHT